MTSSENKESGLSSTNRNLLALLVFVVLLLWGPIALYGMVIRTVYLIVLPALLWFGLRYFGSKWEADELANERLTRGIAGILAGALFVGAYLSFNAAYHSECTQTVRSRDEYECVGDYVRVPGGDRSGAFILAMFGILATWYAVAKHTED